MPAAQKSGKLVKPAAKPVAKKVIKPVPKPTRAAPKAARPAAKSQPKVAVRPATKVKSVPASKSPVAKSDKATAKAEPLKKPAKATAPAAPANEVAKKKPGRPPKAASADTGATATGAKRGRKAKIDSKPGEDLDMAEIEADLVGEPVAETTEKVKPLRMKISKAKERALMKEFGLDETVLSEEDMAKRRQRLKTLITLGKTRGYLTHAEISDHLPDKLIDAETLEVVVTMLNDLGVAVY